MLANNNHLCANQPTPVVTQLNNYLLLIFTILRPYVPLYP